MLIGLTGSMGSGKDTFYKILKNEYDIDIKRLAFGDNVKRAAYAIFGGDRNKYFGTQEEKNEELPFWKAELGEAYSTYRKIAQTFGTEICRHNIHQDVWVLSLESKVKELLSSGKHVAVTDVRFDNEAKMIQSYGGLVIEMINTNNTHVGNEHASEAGVSPELIDMQIVADNLSELSSCARTFVDEHFCN